MKTNKLFGMLAILTGMAAFIAGGSTSSAQNLTVRGIVRDAIGPIAGAVVLSGNANAVTDIDGAYSITVPSNAVLEVSCLGYATQQVPVNGRSTIDIVLTEDVQMLHEAVALGYGAQTKKKDLSASVGIVNNADELAARPVTSTEGMLQGQIPGVTISANGGSPDSTPQVIIRGQGSRNGDSVLWVVDGVPGAPITSMNDIESIVVLKDAASAAIYGATSGAGGVILVTTKKGSQGIHVEYNLVTGANVASNLPQSLNAQQEIEMRKISYANAGLTLPTGWDTNVNPWVGTTRTNWMDEIFRTAFYQRHGLTLNYGSDKLKSRLTFSYQDNPGVLVGTFKKELGVRYNGEYQLNKYIKITEDLSYGDVSSRGTNTSSAYSGSILSAIYMPQSAEAYATAGPYAGSYGGTVTEDPAYIAKYGSNFADIHGDAINPLRLLLADTRYDHTTKFWTTTGLEIANIVKGLKFNSKFTYNNSQWLYKNFNPKRPEIGKPALDNKLKWITSRDEEWRTENTLTFDRTFGKHTVGALLSTTANRSWGRGFSLVGKDFEDESEALQYIAFAGTVTAGDNDTKGDWYTGDDANVAFIARGSYSYDDRYFVTASWRRDYAGRLPKGHNKGDFPAVTGAWKISSEPFFPQTDAISLLKLRASWGRVGNLGSIGLNYKSANLSSSNWNESAIYGVETGAQYGTFWFPQKAVNQLLTWETSEQFDGGIDVDLFRDRLSLSVDYYNKRTFNLIQDQTMGWPQTIGLDAMKVNQGEIRNTGVEFLANWKDKIGKDFNYYVTGNFAYNHNAVISTGVLDEDGNAGKWTGGGDFRMMPWIYQSEAGQPLNSFYVIKTDGIFQSEEDVYDHVKDGKLIQPAAQAGDLRFVDANGDGKIDDNDRQYVGSAMPKYTFALSAGFNYKNFNFSMMWQGVAGNKIAYVGKQMILGDVEGNFNRSVEILNAWSPINTGSSIPRLSKNDPNGNFSTPSDWYIEDGSYLRLKNVTIGYDFTSLLRKCKHFNDRGSSLNVYFSGENLLTITKYSGMDPEVGGWDGLMYPVSRVFAFGVKLTY
ncbi:MAG: TonB-dependent receptor [Bacteroidales bacterium]|nr:TonB-dependent receptor [Bacteroidales bacterium]